MGLASQLLEAVRKGYKLDKRTREAINRDLERAGLDGNGRFQSIGRALNAAHNVLEKHGFEWGQVTSADLFRGRPSGTQSILVAKKDPDDPFSPEEVGNTSLAFQWSELRKNNFEVIAYLG